MAEPKRPRTKPLRPADLEEHGVTIPVPTPTSIHMPNPWQPGSNGQMADAPTVPKPGKQPEDR